MSYIPPTPEEAIRNISLPPEQIRQLEILIKLMARLRAPDGCPWDQVQTHESLLPNLLEEAYEYLHAVRENDVAGMREELGDLLLQVIFHAQIAESAGTFDLGSSSRELSEKLVRRHPHVFGDATAANESEALASWHSAKKGEGAHTLDLDKVPRAMPALMRARKVQNKAAKVGFQWPDVSGAIDKVDEELAELKEAIGDSAKGDEDLLKREEELGDLLFAVVNVARYIHVDPEVALIGTVEKFIKRFKYIELRLAESGMNLGEASLEEMDRYWDEAKKMNSKT